VGITDEDRRMLEQLRTIGPQLENIRRLVEEFRPELEALGERVDDVEAALEDLEERLTEQIDALREGLERVAEQVGITIPEVPVPRRVTFDASIVYQVGFRSNRASDMGALEITDDLYAAHQSKLVFSGRFDEVTTGRLTYWEDSNANVHHGRGANRHGIDEGWLRTRRWGFDWVFGRHYAGQLFQEEPAEVAPALPEYKRYPVLALGSGLLYYTPVALPGLSIGRSIGSLKLTAVLQGGSVEAQTIVPGTARDGMFVVRGVLDDLFGFLDVGVNYMNTGAGEAKGWSVDVGLEILNREVKAEYATLTETTAGVEPPGNDTAFMVAIPYLIGGPDSTLSIGACYGEVEQNFAPGTSIVEIPYILVPENAVFDRPLFLATNSKGYEITVGLRIAGVPIDIRYYDTEASTGPGDPEPVTLVTLTRQLSARSYLNLSYGFQKDGAGPGDDLQLARVYVGLGF